MAKKEPKPRKPSKLEEITLAAKQEHSHLNTIVILKKRQLFQFEIDQLEESIVALYAAANNAKERRAKLQAMIVGLGLVVEKR